MRLASQEQLQRFVHRLSNPARQPDDGPDRNGIDFALPSLADLRFMQARAFRAALGTQSGPDGGYLIEPAIIPRVTFALLQGAAMLRTSEVLFTDKGNRIRWPLVDDTTNMASLAAENQSVGPSTGGTGQGVDPSSFGTLDLDAKTFNSGALIVPYSLFEDADAALEGGAAATIFDMLGRRCARGINEYLTNSASAGITNVVTVGRTGRRQPRSAWMI